MHELSLSGAIVNTVVKHAEGRPVSLVSLRVGALRQVLPDTLEFYFEFVSRGTVCEGARLEQELIPALLRCAGCQREWTIEMPIFLCPSCGHRSEIFSHGGARATAERYGVDFLGEIPLDLTIREDTDAGRPPVVSQPDGPQAAAYLDIARKVIEKLSPAEAAARPFPKIVFEN